MLLRDHVLWIEDCKSASDPDWNQCIIGVHADRSCGWQKDRRCGAEIVFLMVRCKTYGEACGLNKKL